jgi:2',3'-cyclic-nucleotide 2'-phosphodiesterase (5'-nucleotidase family)
VADQIKAGCKAEIAIINSGSLRADKLMPPGPITYRDLVSLLPMLDELTVLGLTGAQVHSARFPTEIYARGCHWYPRLLASSEQAQASRL